MKAYISGKITGLDRQVCENNFARAEKYLKDKGYEVVNPTRLCGPETPWAAAMKICIEALLKCDAIYLLQDWKDSKGAMLEFSIAESVNIQKLNYCLYNYNEIRDAFKSVNFRKTITNLIESKTNLRYPDSMHLQNDIELHIFNILNENEKVHINI
ncbi:MAG: DUF4406 domain-containing protein [Patescibacteria group bacterium]|nr:DUF4406 domain-containing protein [Patescibacteria group bacterium]